MKINFLTSHNHEGSVTRAIAMFANSLTKLGHDVVISYPIVQQYCHYKYRLDTSSYFKVFLFIIKNVIKFGSKHWSGIAYGIDKKVEFNKYLLMPSSLNMPDSDIIVTFQQALLPSMIELSEAKGLLIDILTSSEYEGDIHEKWFDHTMKRYSKIIAIPRYVLSNRMSMYFLNSGISNDGIIPLGVDGDMFFHNKYSEKDDGILFFISPWGAKGASVSIDIAKCLRRLGVENKFYTVGNTSGLDVSVFDHNYGYVESDEYSSIYRRHKYFIYTSLFDGFPTPPLEAMKSGAVCILSNTPGVEDYSENGVSSLLCHPGNVQEFVDSVTKVISDEVLCKKLSKNAISRAETMTWDSATDEMVRLFYIQLRR
jgi:glycosyltransferase involved in cell wall biosynthesis